MDDLNFFYLQKIMQGDQTWTHLILSITTHDGSTHTSNISRQHKQQG
jgi:hypothetical protein